MSSAVAECTSLEELDELEAEADADALAVDWAGRPPAVIAQAVVQQARIQNKLDAARLAMVGALDASKEWMRDGSRSAGAWITTQCHQKPVKARHDVRLARALRSMPHTERALAACEITVDHVDVLAKCNTTDLAEVFADSERRLVAEAKNQRFVAFEQAVRYWRDVVAPDDADERAQDALEQRRWHASKTFEDMLRVDGWLDPIGGSEYLAELSRLTDLLFEEDWAAAKARLGEGNLSLADLRRTPAQRRADAQVLMARRSANTTTNGNPARPVLNVIIDWATYCATLAHLEGRTDVAFPEARTCEVADGTHITPIQALSLGLAGEIRPLLIDADGVPLDYGRARRFFTGDLRTAIVLTHRYCTHESGCDVPSYRCQIDHIKAFADGGATAAVNGDPKCPPHNRHKETQDRKQRVVQRR